MGRDAKLRRQRRDQRQDKPTGDLAQASAPKAERSPFQNLEEFDQVEVPAIAPTVPTSQAQSSSPSWFKRLLPFNRAAKNTLDQSGADTGEFFETYQMTLGAIAWHGYKTQGRGFVLATPTERDTVQLRYVSRKSLNQLIQPEKRAACRQIMENYDPQTEVILVKIAPTGEMILNSPQPAEPSPQLCYQQWQAQE